MKKTPTSHSETSRQAILQAAYELFLDNGYSATSMRQISQRAGLALGGIYNHFPGKEAIYSTLFVERYPFQQILPILMANRAESIEQFIRTSAHVMVTELWKRPDFIKLMFIEIVEFNGRNMPLVQREVLRQVMPLVEKFTSAKQLRQIPTFDVFRAFLGLFFSYYITELMLADLPLELKGEQTLDHFVDIFLHGVMKTEVQA